jgi:hypothetical protein
MTVTYETFEHRSVIEEVAIIHNEDGSYTSMLKSEYDRREAEQSTLNLS